MGKYSHVIDNLPRTFGTEPDFQDKVNGIKARILEPEPDGSTPADRKELSSEAVEEMVSDITATLSVLNDCMIRALGGNRHATRIARAYRDLRIIKDAIEEQEKVTNVLLEAYKQILVDQYEAEGTISLKLDDGGTVRVQIEPHSKVVDKALNRKWAMENNLENLLTLPWQTVNALAKQALLDGNELPDGVEIDARPKVVCTKK